MLVVPLGWLGPKGRCLSPSLQGCSRRVVARGQLHDWRLVDLRLRSSTACARVFSEDWRRQGRRACTHCIVSVHHAGVGSPRHECGHSRRSLGSRQGGYMGAMVGRRGVGGGACESGGACGVLVFAKRSDRLQVRKHKESCECLQEVSSLHACMN